MIDNLTLNSINDKIVTPVKEAKQESTSKTDTKIIPDKIGFTTARKYKPDEDIKEISSSENINTSNIIEDETVKTEEAIKDELIAKIILLKKELEASKRQSGQQKFHDVIHKYNETKDIAQEILGRIASTKNKMIKDLYEDLGISDDDA